ncbi:MAG: GGDEF domain-containing protein [Alphaproteobacteria bacterium]|jgi:diguanylate cyclase (GGDEF)-like protein|nr:GGDEF domain-containing protein [Alphaproteobacteria bacterium]MBT7941723.1 GGDEF domain-containing protein [Alphaproteobacteria bacterium]
MLKNLRLRTINLMVSGLIGMAGVGLAFVLAFTVQNVQTIEASWYNYQADRSDKARLESVLRAAVGYGGMIHEFKNYVLRHEENRMDRVQANIGAARAIIDQYRSLGLSQAETVALEDISTILNKYDQALFKTRDLILAKQTPRDIDTQVKIDDTAALRGLKTLHTEILRRAGVEKSDDTVKGRVAADLRAALGYGGMIHEYKNLILRHDLPRVTKIRSHISQIEQKITAYRKLGPNTAEKIALDDIETTVAQYKGNLDSISELIKASASVAEIDKTVKVDDSAALRGLRTLDKEVALQVDILSRTVGDDLTFLVTVVPIFTWISLGIIVLTVGTSVWIFQVYVIRPISTATTLMNLLATDETGISIQGMEQKNEIGQMARALETFRQNIISRKAAESEILEMAYTDPLTGLDNRKRFEEHLVEAINMANRTGGNIACLMIDLDKFKPVNDTYGHAAGDEVLKVVGQRLALISRDTDFVARLGGDEFAMIATAIEDAINAELPAKRIVDQLSLPVYFEDNDLKIGGSVGVAIFPRDADNPNDLLKLADDALYAAKDAGRNTFRFAKAKSPKATPPAK